MDDVAAERFGIPLAERLCARRLDLAAGGVRQPAPEDVVLAAGIDADHRPHQMVVRPDRHARAPDDVENRQIRGVIELLHLGAAGLAEPGEYRTRVSDGPRHHLAHPLVAWIGADRLAAILDEAIEIEHGSLPFPYPLVRRWRGDCFASLAMTSKRAVIARSAATKQSRAACRYSAAAPASAAASERWPFWWK
jgi:hypothetical protein